MVLKHKNSKKKDSEINAAQLCLQNPGLHGYVYDFSVICDSIDVDDILDIHKYLIKNRNIKQCFH